jgi:predicted permease
MKTEGGTTFTNPIWEQVRDRQDVFSGAFAYSPIRLNLAGGGEVRNANTSWVSGEFFSTLGVQPLLGRTFTAADDKRGCPVIGVLSYDFWQREYGGTAGVFDRRLTLNTHPVRIVGVAPRGFTGIQVGEAVDVYMPLCAEGTRVDPHSAMKANARGVVESHARFGLGKMLVTVQVALSLVLLVGAGLMLKTFAKLARLDTGFDKNQVLLIRVDPRYASVPLDRRLSLYQELQQRLAVIPGVRSASFADITPVSGSDSNQIVHVEGYLPKSRKDMVAWINSISPGFFVTMQTPFIAGRDFNEHDTLHAPLVAVINESMANKFFGSPLSAVGKTFRNGWNEISGPIQIVGVVKDTKYTSLRAEGEAIAYYPLSKLPPMRWANFVLRANEPAASLIPSVKAAVDEVNHAITLQFRTLALQVDESLGRERLLATLSGFFGALALALAVIGLYGVMSYNLARRRNEIGIRMALGAEQARVLRMVLGEVAILIVAGLALGLAGAVSSTRLLASFLYRLEPNDPTTLVTAGVVLAVSAVVAGLLPARRAANLDPMTALREE